MKRIRFLRSLSGLLSFAVAASAQTMTNDFAPINLGNFVMTSTPSNATGNGGISTIFTSSGTELTFGTGGALVNPLDFSYTVTGPDTATISRVATGSAPASTTNLVFKSASSGTYTTMAGTETTTGTFNLADIPGAAPIANVSTRTTVSPGVPTIVGFVVAGTMPRRVLVRAVGPALSSFGVTSPLSNPSLSLYRGTQAIATNDDWGTLASLSSGMSAGSSSNGTGTGLLSGLGSGTGATSNPGVTAGTGSTTDTGTTSTTGTTTTGTTGTTTSTSGGTSTSTTTTATGTLTDGVFTGTLANGQTFTTQLASDATFTQVGAFGLQAGSQDAAFVVTLPPGAYSVVVNNSTTTTAGTSGISGGSTSSGSTTTSDTSSSGTTSGGTMTGGTGTATGSTNVGTTNGNTSTTGSTTGTVATSTTTSRTTGEVLVEVYFLE